MKKIVFVTFISVFTAVALLGLQTSVHAEDGYGLSETASEAGINTSGNLPTLIGGVIGTALSLIGIVFFIILVYAGFMWMTSRGNPEINKKSLNTISSAIIGLIVVLASYAITQLVLNSLGGPGPGDDRPPSVAACSSFGDAHTCVAGAANCQDGTIVSETTECTEDFQSCCVPSSE